MSTVEPGLVTLTVVEAALTREAIEGSLLWDTLSYVDDRRSQLEAIVEKLTSPVTEVVNHTCGWCDINPDHPRCPENAEWIGPDHDCPDCGYADDDLTSHKDGCPRIGTCGQVGPPWLGPPFHPADVPFDREVHRDHMAAVHGLG